MTLAKHPVHRGTLSARGWFDETQFWGRESGHRVLPGSGR